MWIYINALVVAPVLLAVGYYTIPVELAHIRHLEEHPDEWSGAPYSIGF